MVRPYREGFSNKVALFMLTENLLMQKSPAFVLKYIVTRSHVDRNNQDLQTPE